MLSYSKQTIARRARLSSKAIFAALALTLAAGVALIVAANHEQSTVEVKVLGPVHNLPVIKTSGGIDSDTNLTSQN